MSERADTLVTVVRTALHDRRGQAVAYIDERGRIYNYSGAPLALLRRDNIYSYSGKHLGVFKNGWVRDHRGGCVMYAKGARGGPVPPVPRVPPVPSVPRVPPVPSVPEVPPVPAVPSRNWSQIDAAAFLAR